MMFNIEMNLDCKSGEHIAARAISAPVLARASRHVMDERNCLNSNLLSCLDQLFSWTTGRLSSKELP